MAARYTELVVPLLLNKKRVVGIVDTGSNITLLHQSMIGDAADPANDRPFSVDFARTVERRVAFMSGVGVSRDAVADIRTEAGNTPLEAGAVVTIVDLHETIQNFPQEVDMIVGTNALASKVVKFEAGRPPEVLTRAGFRALQKSEAGMLEIDTVGTMCDLPRDSLGPLFMVRVHNAEVPGTVFLADTGNKFSSFCLENQKRAETDRVNAAVCGVGLECFACGETNAQIGVRGRSELGFRPMTIRQKLQKIPPPESLTSIEAWCRDENGERIDIQGNLGIDFWAGLMRLTVFDFHKRKIFCVPSK